PAEQKYSFWKRFEALGATSHERFMNTFARVRSIAPVNWTVLRNALPAFTMLAGMSFFAGLLIGNRQPLVVASVSAAATVAPHISTNVNQQPKQQPTIQPANVAKTTPSQTSHLQITDRETAATIAELSKVELKNLHRTADYGDDEAAMQLG